MYGEVKISAAIMLIIKVFLKKWILSVILDHIHSIVKLHIPMSIFSLTETTMFQ